MSTVRRLDPGAQRSEWLALRKTGIGGSDAAAAIGRSPYKTRLQLWAEKTGKVEPEDISDLWRIRVGNDLEAYCAQLYTEETGRRVRKENFILRADQYPWALANLDYRTTMEPVAPDQKATFDGILECKTADWRVAEHWDERPPLFYEVQMQHYLAVTGKQRGSFAVFILGAWPPFRTFDVERDEEFIGALMEAEAEFWNYVQHDTPPPEGASGRDIHLLHQLYKIEPKKIINGTDEALAIDAEIKALNEAIKVGKTKVDDLKARLLELLGDGERLQLPGGAGGWRRKECHRDGYSVEATDYIDFRRVK